MKTDFTSPVATAEFSKFDAMFSAAFSQHHLLEFSTVYCDPHSQVFGIVNKAEIDVFLELSCFFDDPADVGSLISGSSAISKTS